MKLDQPDRFRQLDSLRGVAALVVVLGHMYLSINDDPSSIAFMTPLSPFVTGPIAVVLFFVLSGFVLSLPYLRGKRSHYLPYAVRRVFRLYIPFAVAVLLASLFFEILGGYTIPDLSKTLSTSWDAPISGSSIAAHFLMAGYPADATRLDPPIWSLVIEMRASLIFPLLVILVVRLKWLAVLGAILISMAAFKLKTVMGETSSVDSDTLSGTVLSTANYLVFFIFGIACALWLERTKDLLRKISAFGHAMLIGGFLCACEIVAKKNLIHHGYTNILYGAFATYLIACCVTFSLPTRLLMHAWCVWLGRVSFSLYLIHWPILLACYYLLARDMPNWGVLAIALPVILVAAHAMARWIEQPSHEWGKRVARHMESYLDRRSIAT